MEARNQYGYPVISKIEQAKRYAAAARERNKPECQCDVCKQMQMLPAVLQIVNNWGKK